MRCRIGEDERPEPASAKLRATLDEHLLDPDERAFVEPRLAHLLGLEERAARRAPGSLRARGGSSSSGWPTRPDRARLRGHAVGGHEPARLRRVPARVVARPPALRDHARAPGAARAPARLGRRAAELHLALPRAAVRGSDGGAARRARARACRTQLREQILARAEGVPLYAVETVRMLLDRGLLARGRRLPAGRARSRPSRCRRRCTP